jgi:hypothetical protein
MVKHLVFVFVNCQVNFVKSGAKVLLFRDICKRPHMLYGIKVRFSTKKYLHYR